MFLLSSQLNSLSHILKSLIHRELPALLLKTNTSAVSFMSQKRIENIKRSHLMFYKKGISLHWQRFCTVTECKHACYKINYNVKQPKMLIFNNA